MNLETTEAVENDIVLADELLESSVLIDLIFARSSFQAKPTSGNASDLACFYNNVSHQ